MEFRKGILEELHEALVSKAEHEAQVATLQKRTFTVMEAVNGRHESVYHEIQGYNDLINEDHRKVEQLLEEIRNAGTTPFQRVDQ